MHFNLQDIARYHIGDIITLSDLQTQIEFDSPSVDFTIDEVRHYREANGVFELYGFIVHTTRSGQEEPPYMIVAKVAGNAHDMFIYYLDSSSELYIAKQGQPECVYVDALFTQSHDNFKDRIAVDIAYGEEVKNVSWDLQDTTYGVRYKSTNKEEGIVTLGDFYTNDDNKGNSYCLMIWTGRIEKGYIEIWYGANIKDHEVDFLPVGH